MPEFGGISEGHEYKNLIYLLSTPRICLHIQFYFQTFTLNIYI